MELFTLGVGNYTQNDVHQAALGFTGYQVDQTSGAVTFDPKYHDNPSQRSWASGRSSTR